VPNPALDAGEVEEAAKEAAEEAEEQAEEEAEAAEDAAEDAGPPPSWTIQPGGRLGFSVTYGSDSYRGSFSDWSGTIRFDPDHPENAPDIRISVPLASASMGDATQDSMLQGGDFFASSANPTATFRSTSVRQTGPGRYTAQGTLSLRGASRPQSLSFTLSGEGLRRRVEGNGTINRTAFGVGTGDSAEGLGTSVTLNFAFDAVGRAP
jgi:polyisoprenoid-binding protein YceI